MLATPHAVIGALLATQIHNPVIGLPVAFFSHFLFDLVPHWDWGWHPGESGRMRNPKKRMEIFWESTIDVIFGFVLCFALFLNFVHPVYLVAMILAAQGPDWLEVPYWFLHIKIWPFPFIAKIQSKMQLHAKLPWGITNQILAVVLLWIVLYYLR